MALIYFYDASPLDREQLSAALQDTDHHWEFISDKVSLEHLHPDTEVLSMFVTSKVTREIIEHLPKLRVIACRSTGFNNVDLDAAAEHDVTIVNVPSYGEATVAEYAFTMMSALLRKLPQVIKSENEFVQQESLRGTDLEHKTLGVIGTGRIGQHAIKIANGYGMRVVGYDLYPSEKAADELGFEYVELETLLTQADVITIHAPYTPQTHHLLSTSAFDLMKPTATLVNTARGEIVDTKALVVALENKQLAGAALDVVEGEALLIHHEEVALLRSGSIENELLQHSVELSLLQKMPNVIISPHNAFNTTEAIHRINQTTADNIISFWYGDMPNKVQANKAATGTLYVARHAESEWNATGQWTGITDVHLSDKGFREAALLGQALKKASIRVDIAYCSEQIRTRETLEGMLNASGQFEVDIVRDGALNERDYGDYTGRNKWEMKEQLGEGLFNLVRRSWNQSIPGGETLKMVYERVVPFYVESIVPRLLRGENVLLVAHGNSIRALTKYLESISDADIEQVEMLFGQIVSYAINDEGLADHKSVTSIDTTPPNA